MAHAVVFPEVAARVRSRRTLDWGILALTFVVSASGLAWLIRPPRIGDEREVVVSLVPADARKLDCASARSFGPFRCRFSSPQAPADKVPVADQLAPYVTSHREIIVLGGLFAQPAVRAAAERHSRLPRRRRRFEVTCRVRLMAQVDRIGVRFSRRDDFGNHAGIWVARVLSCATR